MTTRTKASQAEIVSMLIDTQGYDKEEATEIAESVNYSLQGLAEDYYPGDPEAALELMEGYLGINQ